MLMTRVLLITLSLYIFGCGLQPTIESHRTDHAMLKNSEEGKMGENGEILILPGFTKSEKINVNGEITSQIIKENPEDPLFYYNGPEDSIIEFSGPILSTAPIGPLLTNTVECSSRNYSHNISKFKDLPKNKGSYIFCIRLTKSGESKYLLTPSFKVESIGIGEIDPDYSSISSEAECNSITGYSWSSANNACYPDYSSISSEAECNSITGYSWSSANNACYPDFQTITAEQQCNSVVGYSWDTDLGICKQNRSKVMLCGTSGQSITTFIPEGFGLSLVAGNNCAPDGETQVIFVTRNAADFSNLKTYVEQGGIVITEYSISDEVYNAVFDASVIPGSNQGGCSDQILPAIKVNTSDPFWAGNPSFGTSGSGCGYNMGSYPGIIPLGTWSNGHVSLAYKTLGSGRVWFIESDWQDGGAGSVNAPMMKYMVLNR